MPPPNNVSDFVNVDPIILVGSPFVFGLDVTLVSDTESLLNVSYGQIHIPETRSIQNLDSLITGFYGWDFSIPAVKVTSDESDVPEPSTCAMMFAGFGGLCFPGYRKARKGVAFAA